MPTGPPRHHRGKGLEGHQKQPPQGLRVGQGLHGYLNRDGAVIGLDPGPLPHALPAARRLVQGGNELQLQALPCHSHQVVLALQPLRWLQKLSGAAMNVDDVTPIVHQDTRWGKALHQELLNERAKTRARRLGRELRRGVRCLHLARQRREIDG